MHSPLCNQWLWVKPGLARWAGFYPWAGPGFTVSREWGDICPFLKQEGYIMVSYQWHLKNIKTTN